MQNETICLYFGTGIIFGFVNEYANWRCLFGEWIGNGEQACLSSRPEGKLKRTSERVRFRIVAAHRNEISLFRFRDLDAEHGLDIFFPGQMKINRRNLYRVAGHRNSCEFRGRFYGLVGSAERGREVDGILVLTKSVNGEVGVGALQPFLRPFSPRSEACPRVDVDTTLV